MTDENKNKAEKAKKDLLKAGGIVSDLLAESASDLVQEMADNAKKEAAPKRAKG